MMALEYTDTNFQEFADNKDKLSVVDFWAEWCGPCRMITPVIEAVAEEYKDVVNVGKMNVDDNNETPTKFQVRSIPTILFMKGGEVLEKHVGTITKAKLVDLIEKHK